MKNKIEKIKSFIKENWFKIIIVILLVWFLLVLSKWTFDDSFSIDICLKEASGLPPIVPKHCW